MTEYYSELTAAMTMLAQHPKTIFVGQSIRYGGQSAHETFSGVPDDRKVEFPVAENFQLGFCIGLALEGYIPICFFPRIDFLVCAMDQLVNHLDKIPVLGDFRPKIIIRTAIGSTSPLDPGPQHCQDHTRALRQMSDILVVELEDAKSISEEYVLAIRRDSPTLLVEYGSKYRE